MTQQRRLSVEEQNQKIHDSALEMVAYANSDVTPSRMVTFGAASEVVRRSLAQNKNYGFAMRSHKATVAISDFINVWQKDKTNRLKPENTDLLPVAHPRSTKPHAMTASGLRHARARWHADDPRIVNDEVRPIVAALLSSDPNSIEFDYFSTRLSSFPQGSVPIETLLAAIGDGNSSAARSARARAQRRDRKGRFAWQGGGLSAFVRMRDGIVRRLSGRMVAAGVGGDDTFDVELEDGRIARVPAQAAEAVKAFLPSPDAPDGFSPQPAQIDAGDPVINFDDLQFVDVPNGFRKDENYGGPGERFLDDAYAVYKYPAGSPDAPEVEGADPAKPTYEVRRLDGDRESDNFAVGQSWANMQDAIRADEPKRDAEEGREPDPVAVLDDNQYDDLMENVGDRDPREYARELLGQQERPAAQESSQPLEFDGADNNYYFDVNEDYEPRGREDQESEDYTDDPAELANKFNEMDLRDALEEAVIGNRNEEAGGVAQMPFDGGLEDVPAEAIYAAMREKGMDAEMELAEIYDGNLGGRPQRYNQDLVEQRRAGREEQKAELPTPEAADLPPLLDGLSEQEKADFEQSGDYKPYLPKNEPFDAPEGYWPEMDGDAFENVDEDPNVDPLNLAQNVDQQDLEAAYREALEPNSQLPGYGNVPRTDENGEEVVDSVPAEAIRDALQLQGVDTNELNRTIADEAAEGQQGPLDDAEAADILDQAEADAADAPEEPQGAGLLFRKPDQRYDRGREFSENYVNYLNDADAESLTNEELDHIDMMASQVALWNNDRIRGLKEKADAERARRGDDAGPEASEFDGDVFVPNKIATVPMAEVPQEDRDRAADLAAELGYSQEAQDLIRNGGDYVDILDALNAQQVEGIGGMRNPYQDQKSDYETRMFVDMPRKPQREQWDRFEQFQNVLDAIGMEPPKPITREDREDAAERSDRLGYGDEAKDAIIEGDADEILEALPEQYAADAKAFTEPEKQRTGRGSKRKPSDDKRMEDFPDFQNFVDKMLDDWGMSPIPAGLDDEQAAKYRDLKRRLRIAQNGGLVTDPDPRKINGRYVEPNPQEAARLQKEIDDLLAGAEAEAPEARIPSAPAAPAGEKKPGAFYGVDPDGNLDLNMEYTDEYVDYLYNTDPKSMSTSELSDLKNLLSQVAPENKRLVARIEREVDDELALRAEMGPDAEAQLGMFEGQRFVNEAFDKNEGTPSPFFQKDIAPNGRVRLDRKKPYAQKYVDHLLNPDRDLNDLSDEELNDLFNILDQMDDDQYNGPGDREGRMDEIFDLIRSREEGNNIPNSFDGARFGEPEGGEAEAEAPQEEAPATPDTPESAGEAPQAEEAPEAPEAEQVTGPRKATIISPLDEKKYEVELRETDEGFEVVVRDENGNERVIATNRDAELANDNFKRVSDLVADGDVDFGKWINEENYPGEKKDDEAVAEAKTPAARWRANTKKGKRAAANGWDNATPKMPMLDRLVGRERLPKRKKGEVKDLGAARSMLKKFVAGWDSRGNKRPRPTHRIESRELDPARKDDGDYRDINGNIIREGDIVAHNRAGELVNPEREAVNIIKGRVLRRESYVRNGVVRPGGLYVEVLDADDPEWIGREFFYVAGRVEIVEQPDLKERINREDDERAARGEIPFEEQYQKSLWGLDDDQVYLLYGSALDTDNKAALDLAAKELAARNLMVPQDLAEFLSLLPDEGIDFIPENIGLGEGVHGQIVKRIVDNERERRRKGEAAGKLPKEIFQGLNFFPEREEQRPESPQTPQAEERPEPTPEPEPEAPAPAEAEVPAEEPAAEPVDAEAPIEIEEPDVEALPEVEGLDAADVVVGFREQGKAWVEANAKNIDAKAGDVRVNDFIKTKNGNYGRVVSVEDLGGRVRITVEWSNGKEYAYRPWNKNTDLEGGIYRADVVQKAPAAPAEEPVVAPETPAEAAESPEIEIPEAPVPNAIDIREAKVRAKAVAKKFEEKELPDPDVVGIKQETIEYYRDKVVKELAPEGPDRRRDKGLNEALDEAIKVAKYFGWFDEAQELIAIRQRKDGLGLRPMSPELAPKIDNLRGQGFADMVALRKDVKQIVRWDRSDLNNLREAVEKIALNPDPYNVQYRAGVMGAKAALDRLADRQDIKAQPELLDKINNFRAYIDDLGDLPPLPKRKPEDGGEAYRVLEAPLADFAGLNIDDIKNGTGDWVRDRALSNGINKVYLMRNKVTGAYVVVKQDDDYARRGGRQFRGNGINAEEMVAQIYRDMGFAVPVVRVINPDAQNINDRGIAVMEYAGPGFFGLERIDVAANRYEANGDIDNIIPEYQAEILDFVVANGIIGNTDRHGRNYMYGQDPMTGKWRLVPIDNGLAMFNGHFGDAEARMPDALALRPDKVIQGVYGNANGARGLATQYIRRIGKDAARDQVREFAERMQKRAEVMKFIDPRGSEYISERAQWILDNLDKYLDAITGGRY